MDYEPNGSMYSTLLDAAYEASKDTVRSPIWLIIPTVFAIGFFLGCRWQLSVLKPLKGKT